MSLSFVTGNDDRVVLLSGAVMNWVVGKSASLELLACNCGDPPFPRAIYASGREL